jgi:hypothetical protein
MPTKREVRALIKGMLERTATTWDESAALLDNLARLHVELQRLLTESGLFQPGEVTRLLREVDFAVLRHAEEIGALARAAQQRAWARGVNQFDETMGLFQVGYVKGVTGAESALAQAYMTVDRIKQVTEEMRGLIRGQVLSGLYLQKTPFEVMASITNIIGIRNQAGFRELGTTGISAKAERIMRTELMGIQNAGSWERRMQALQQFPDLEDVWAATGDTRTRLDHLVAHGQKKGTDGYFEVGGERARFPGDPSLSARQRVNCRCTAIPYRSEWGEVEFVLGPLAGQVEEERERRQEAVKNINREGAKTRSFFWWR